MTTTIWEKIYQSYENGAQKWGSHKKKLLPDFLRFIKKSNFKIKNALDIGCGDSRYLIFLKENGFKITGIDSSKTAIKVSRKILGREAKLICAEMFDYDFPANKYDLIFSIQAIHHGFKKDIARTIKKIHRSLIVGGVAFITLPDTSNIYSWNTFKKRKKIEAGTFTPLLGPEKGLVHSFFNKSEIEVLFSKFSKLKICSNKEIDWIIIAEK